MFSGSTINAVAIFATVAYLEVLPAEATYYPSNPCTACPSGTTLKTYYVLAETDDYNQFPFTFSGDFLSFDPHNPLYCFGNAVHPDYQIDPYSFDTPNPFEDGGLFDGQLYFAGGAYSGNSYADDIMSKFEDGSEARQVCRFKEDGHYHVEQNHYGYYCKDNNDADNGCVQDIVFDMVHSFVRNVQLAIECCMGCGNGVKEEGEECDDGNDIDDDECSNSCTVPSAPECGNGIVEEGEECDDGNHIDDDECSNSCTLPPVPDCGNGIVEEGEECDDGNHIDDDGCSNSCTLPQPECGNGIVEGFEQCDDGNDIDDDGCSNSCTLPNVGGGGGDPHIKRWNQKHDSFHGECDMVFLSSKEFHDGAGLDIHVRATIDAYYSFFETAAFRVGGEIIELYRKSFYVNGEKRYLSSLPWRFGEDSRYHLEEVEAPEGRNPAFYTYYKLSWENGKSHVLFTFYKNFLTLSVSGHAEDFADSVGLLGDFHTGAMIDRDGVEMSDFQAYGFEWQTSPDDPKLFVVDRDPQLPFEKCRLPTAPRPSRRALRGEEHRLHQEAMEECAQAEDLDLCMFDVMSTGDIGMATLWD